MLVIINVFASALNAAAIVFVFNKDGEIPALNVFFLVGCGLMAIVLTIKDN